MKRPLHVLLVATALSPAVALLAGENEAAEAPVSTVVTVASTSTSAEKAKPDPLEGIKSETARLQAEREKINAELLLAQAKLEQQLAPKKLEMIQIQTQMDEIKAKRDLSDLNRKVGEEDALVDLKKRAERLMLESNIAKNEVDIEGYDIKRGENDVRRKTSSLALQMELQQKEAEARTYAPGKEPAYLKEPYDGKKLILSDRRIALNGIVTAKTADNIVERISYYNNRDAEAPIFIVIDDCPGGSVMAGYKILKAMNGSRAPVYTVVKSFAASLAACITTLSKKSFAYPNAIILHHQLSSVGMGNLTQQREAVKELEEWWKRLAEPIAAKMGITRDEFINRMYAHSSTGDWNEFADNAQKLGWVDVVVEDIEETSMLRHPDTQAAPSTSTTIRLASNQAAASQDGEVVQATDERGKPMAILPRLNPLDAYWLYNPDSYYRGQ